MEEEVKFQEAVPVSQPPVLLPKNNNLLKIILLIILGLLVAGGLVYAGMNLSKKQTPLEVVPQTIQPTPTLDPTANWKTYKDTIAPFEIKYPENWTYLTKSKTKSEVDQNGTVVYSGRLTFTGPEGQIDLVFGDGFGGGTCQDMKGPKAKLVQIKIGDEDINLCNYSEGEMEYYSSPFADAGGPNTKNGGFNFSFFYRKDSLSSKDLILEILSTFKFLESQPNSGEAINWNIYENSKYRYTLKYPNNFKVMGEGLGATDETAYLVTISEMPWNTSKKPFILIEAIDWDYKNIEEAIKASFDENKGDEIRSISVGGLEGKFYDFKASGFKMDSSGSGFVIFPELEHRAVYFMKNKILFLMVYTKNDIFEQIFSTFKFLN